MIKKRWFLPTNTENLELLLSNGIITCSAALDGYVKDVMEEAQDGYIPFFSKDNLTDAIAKSRQEDDNLICCIIELDLSQILNIDAYTRASNSVGYTTLNTSDINEKEQWDKLLLPSPLPIQCIKSVFVENTSIKNDLIKKMERDFGVFPPKFFSVGTKADKLFEGRKKDGSLTFNDNQLSVDLPERHVSYGKMFSLGGMLALMFYQSKNGLESVGFFKMSCELNQLSAHEYKEFELINNYFYDSISVDEEWSNLCFELIELLTVKNRTVGEIKKNILDCLGSTDLLKDYPKNLLNRLNEIEDRTLTEPPELVFSKIMKSYKGTTGKLKVTMLLVMYFYRDNVETMLKFYHEDFEAIDYVLFAMFYGVNCRYIGLPRHIKKIKGLNFYLSNRMAEYHHQISSPTNEPKFKEHKSPSFLIGDLIKENSNGDQDKFIEWFSDEFKLNSDKFQSWEVKLKSFQCDSSATLRFKDEPKVSIEQEFKIKTDLNADELIEKAHNLSNKAPINHEELLSYFKQSITIFREWYIKIKGVTCSDSVKLITSDKPTVSTKINITDMERQLLKATIGNDKDLFDYNKVFAQSEKKKGVK